MSILDSLKFCKNGYARKDLIPSLTHYSIRNGRVTAFNGSLAFSSPISLDLDIAPQALHFHKCIEVCDDEISLTLDKDKLRIKSGKFKSAIKCIPTSEVPTIIPRGSKVILPVDFIDKIKKVLSIIDNENEKLYTQGLNFRGKSAWVTNNIIMVELWIGVDLPEITIPKKAIIEICKYGKQIDHVLIDDDMIYFMYSDERWIAAKLLVADCPDFARVVDRPSVPHSLPVDFWEALEVLRFSDEAGKMTLETGLISAGEIASNSVPVATMDCSDLVLEGRCLFNINHFIKLKNILETIELKAGQPCLFFGQEIRGAIVGYRQ